jgi:hypothetical protein
MFKELSDFESPRKTGKSLQRTTTARNTHPVTKTQLYPLAGSHQNVVSVFKEGISH